MLDSVSVTTYLVPSSFGATYEDIPAVSNVTTLTDAFNIAGDAFTMEVGGPDVAASQSTLADGWTVLEVNGTTSILFGFQGLDSYGPGPSFTTDSGAIWSELSVSYIVTDYNDSVPDYGYLTYLRCVAPDELPGVTISQVYRSGSIYVFELIPN